MRLGTLARFVPPLCAATTAARGSERPAAAPPLFGPLPAAMEQRSGIVSCDSHDHAAELTSLSIETAAPLAEIADGPPRARQSSPVLDSHPILPAGLPAALATGLPTSSSSDSLAPVTPAAEDAVAGCSCSPAELTSEAACGTGRCAYVTLLTQGSYLMGVQALSRSLAAVRSRHPLLVMYTADTLASEAVDSLRAEHCQLLPVERYIPAGALAGWLTGCRCAWGSGASVRHIALALLPGCPPPRDSQGCVSWRKPPLPPVLSCCWLFQP